MGKVLIVGGYKSYACLYESFGQISLDNNDFISNPHDYDLVVFNGGGGGTDIHPALYGCTDYTPNYHNITRDMEELFIFKLARSLDIPISGVCRGAQLIWACLGGVLIQNMYNHHGTIAGITSFDNECIDISCDHHQNFYFPSKPDEVEIEMIGSAYLTKFQLPPGVLKLDAAPCIEAFSAPGVMAFQYHPEWASSKSDRQFVWAVEKVASMMSGYNKSKEMSA